MHRRSARLAAKGSDVQPDATKDSKPLRLMSVNRQVRSQSRQIWYFNFQIDGCDAKLFSLFMDLIEPIEAASVNGVTTTSSIDTSDAG